MSTCLFEMNFDHHFSSPVCGIDEVGRGPLAGPVVTACAFIPEENLDHPVWAHVQDSKKLTRKKRESLFDTIAANCIFGLAEASAEEIDTLNIHHATLLAMGRSFEAMIQFGSPPFIPPQAGGRSEATGGSNMMALIDGKFIPPSLPCPAQAIIKGDSKSLCIAAASILAKVTRDRLMERLHQDFPVYGWERNAGYGTAEHLEAIRQNGITSHHRKSFAPCKNLAA